MPSLMIPLLFPSLPVSQWNALKTCLSVLSTGARNAKYPGTGWCFHECICCNDGITKDELAEIQAIFNSFGESEVISEYLMDAVVGVSGSSPAYVYMFIEAMADAAVQTACSGTGV